MIHIHSDGLYDYYLADDKLNNNYADIIKLRKINKKSKKLNSSIRNRFKLTGKEYKELNEKYNSYEVLPFMYNDLFCFAFNNNQVDTDMLINYMEVYKLDSRNYIVRQRDGAYHHLIKSKNKVFYNKKLDCDNCNIIGNIIICDNKIYNYRTRTFSYQYDEISFFNVRKINGKYVECALATILVNCEFSDVEASEEMTFYIDSKGKVISPIETSIGTFNVSSNEELQEVRGKVYNSLRKSNYARRAYINRKKM